jgi:DUF438 domain-containing protein
MGEIDSKTIDLDAAVLETCTKFPEVKDVMAGIGFDEITKPGRLQTMGRFMTLRKGAEHKGVDLNKMVAAFQAAGFAVKGFETPAAAENATLDALGDAPVAATTPEERQQVLKSLLLQLQDGVPVDDVKEIFARNFKDVSGGEIAAAEQSLIAGGVPVEEVQRLCDVHATLFEGHVACAPGAGTPSDPADAPGHPVWIMRQENAAFGKLISGTIRPHIAAALAGEGDAEAIRADVTELAKVGTHYRRKEETIFPHLEAHGVTAPSKVMWGKDDEVRGLVKQAESLARTAAGAGSTHVAAQKLAEACDAAESMVTKEENVLVPLALQTLDARDWKQVAEDGAEYGYVLIDEPPKWRPSMIELAEAAVNAAKLGGEAPAAPAVQPTAGLPGDGKVHLSTGAFTPQQLEAVLNTIPMDITFVDADDKTRYFSHGSDRLFARPMSCLGRDVYDCHPPKSQEMVHKVFNDFRTGARDTYEFWIHLHGKFVYIRYFAVRDADGTYLGALETTMDVTHIQELEGDNRRGADVRREAREAEQAEK